MLSRYAVCDVELPNPGNFPYPGFLQVFIHRLILDLPYPGKIHIMGANLQYTSLHIFLDAIMIRSRNY